MVVGNLYLSQRAQHSAALLVLELKGAMGLAVRHMPCLAREHVPSRPWLRAIRRARESTEDVDTPHRSAASANVRRAMFMREHSTTNQCVQGAVATEVCDGVTRTERDATDSPVRADRGVRRAGRRAAYRTIDSS